LAKLEQPNPTPWTELAAIAAAAAVLFWFVEWQKIVAGLTVVVGLGFVIFWHELGHFLVAKWCGVKVLKFSLGFGLPGVPPIVSFRKGMGLTFFRSRNKEYEEILKAEREGINDHDISQIGETEYAIGVLPLGGFVRMLGEDSGEGDAQTSDPRDFRNKPVGARMAILSAGVIMNFILGFAGFVVVYLIGTMEMPGVIGAVVAGAPAYSAGIRAGDEILSIDGRRDITFDDMRRIVALSGKHQIVTFEMKREGRSDPLRFGVHPVRGPYDAFPVIGVVNPITLQLNPFQPLVPPLGMAGDIKSPFGGFEGDDLIIAAGLGDSLTRVNTPYQLDEILARHAAKPLTFLVRRTTKPKAGQPENNATTTEVSVTLPPNHFMDLGARMTMGPIVAVQGDSLAGKLGFAVGDQILKVDGRADFDPMRLPTYVFERAGKTVAFEISRVDAGGKVSTLNLTVTPDSSPAWTESIVEREALEVPGFGFAYSVSPKVTAVQPGSPAATAGLKPGSELESVTITRPAEKKGEEDATTTIKFDPKAPGWPAAFFALQMVPKNGKVHVTVAGSASSIPIVLEPDPEWFNPRRGFFFYPLTRPVPPQPLGSAISRAWRQTSDVVFSNYALIRGLFQKRLPGNSVGGILRIADMAYGAARSGFDSLLRFLSMLSIGLAVINLFPIPPLDGGQLLILSAEKVRGRPLPERAQVVFLIFGLVLVVLLFVVVTFNDIATLFFSTK
jgi:regulator of sigma E protease